MKKAPERLVAGRFGILRARIEGSARLRRRAAFLVGCRRGHTRPRLQDARTNMARSRKKIGEILVGWGLVTQAQLDEALAKSTQTRKRVGETLVELGHAKDDQIAKALAHQHGMEYVDLAAASMAGKVDAKLIPEELIKKHL